MCASCPRVAACGLQLVKHIVPYATKHSVNGIGLRAATSSPTFVVVEKPTARVVEHHPAAEPIELTGEQQEALVSCLVRLVPQTRLVNGGVLDVFGDHDHRLDGELLDGATVDRNTEQAGRVRLAP